MPFGNIGVMGNSTRSKAPGHKGAGVSGWRWWFAGAFLLPAIVCGLAVIGLITSDVISRYAANEPNMGTVEIAALLFVALFAFALPAASILGDLSGSDSGWLNAGRRKTDRFASVALLEALVFGCFAWFAVETGLDAIATKESTMILQLGLGWFKLALGASFAIAAVAQLATVLDTLGRARQ